MTVQVTGECMGNNLPDGSQVRLLRQRFYLPGDIVVFARSDQHMVSHRLLGFAPGRDGIKAITRADREKRFDRPFEPERILGKVVAIDGKATAYTLLTRARSLVRFVGALFSLMQERFSRP